MSSLRVVPIEDDTEEIPAEKNEPAQASKLLPNFTFPTVEENTPVQTPRVFQNETENTSIMMKRLINENNTLRSELYQIKLANDTLRRHIEHEDDYTRIVTDATILDGVSMAELTSNYARLRQRFNQQGASLNEYKKRVALLQKTLMEKNQMEKKYIDLENLQKQDKKLNKKLRFENEKCKQIESVCKQQETIIKKMEQLLKKRENPRKSSFEYENLENDNAHLQKRVAQLEEQNVDNLKKFEHSIDRSEIQRILNSSENKITALKYEIESNAKKWGKEKSDLLIQLQEAENRFKSAIHVQQTDKEFLQDLPYSRFNTKYS